MQRSGRRILLITAMIAFAAGVGVLYAFAPDQHAFYPRCLLFASTGIQCPGCGGLRAVHQLLHGNLAEAFKLNPLFIILLPLLGWYALAGLIRQTTGRLLPLPFRHPAWSWALISLLILFAITRNLV